MATLSEALGVLIDQLPWLQAIGERVSTQLHEAIRSRPQLQDAVDVLHGKQLGHPLHPALQSVTLSAWALGSAIDLLAPKQDRYFERVADDLITIGTVSALPTALTGLADYSGLREGALKIGTLHMAANVVALSLYGLSLANRKSNDRSMGVALSLAGLGVLTVSGYLGGELAYRLQAGVNQNKPPDDSDRGDPHWHAVLPFSDLAIDETKPISIDDQAILLHRDTSGIYAIGGVCSHAAGPLTEGTFEHGCVTCPWHHSVFDLRNGEVVHGPAVFAQPVYQTRVHDDQIEVLTPPHYEGEGNDQREAPEAITPSSASTNGTFPKQI